MRIILLIIFLSIAGLSNSQKNKEKDSLISILNKHSNDTIGCRALLELSRFFDGNNDSLSLVYAKKCYMLANRKKSPAYIAEACDDIGICFYNSGILDSSIFYYKKAMALFKELKYNHHLIFSDMNLGVSYRQSGKLFKAISCFYEAIKYAEAQKDEKLAAKAKMLLANAYMQKKEYKLAEKYYFESLAVYIKTKDREQIGYLYNNIGLLFSDFKKHDSALTYYFKALKIRDSLKLKRSYAITLENIACEYSDMEEINKAIYYHSLAIAIYEEQNDKKGIAIALTNIAAIDTRKKNYKKAIEELKRAAVIANEISHMNLLNEIYLALSQNYESVSQYQPALEYHKKYLLMKDSIIGLSESEKLIEMNTKYETEKKETQNKLLETKNDLSSATIKQQQITGYFIIGGLILSVLLAIFIFKGLKQQRQANRIITSQKKEVESQKHLVEEKQREILDSIHYAKRIQSTLLAHADFVSENIPNNFILFKPKDIVSGDFYWATKRGHLFYLAICDSTGHGVPGAFMSLLNIGFLSEAINEKNISAPNEVFDYVRDRLVNSISKDGQQDGFDGILLCIDQKKKELRYAAANNAPVIVSGAGITHLRADKMPVGKGIKETPFQLFNIKLKKDETLYLYTDGYADQFGGSKGKKFMYKKLNQLLATTSSEPFDKQKEILNSTFEDWRGNLEQVDDVLIAGLKI